MGAMKRHHGDMSERFKRLIAYDPLAGFRQKKEFKKRAEGGRVSLDDHIEKQAKLVDRRPSNGQKEAGNYRKGHVNIHGLDISIENPRGSWRTGGPEGHKWRSKLPHHYGYIRKTEGNDGDHVDCYIGPHLKAPNVFVIDQNDLGSKRFDEHKCFIGFSSKSQAREAYHQAFSDGRGKDRIGHIETLSVPMFKLWLEHGNTKSPIKRASGGRIHKAGGGALSDADMGIKPMSDADMGLAPPEPDVGKFNAALQGAKAGATFNFNDELAGVRAAAPTVMGHQIPDFLGPVPAKTLAGMGRLAYEHFVPPSDEATSGSAAYEKASAEERHADELAKAQHPYLHMAGEVAGSIPSMALLPELGAASKVGQGASKLARFGADMLDSAVVGGEYGALSGAGEGEGIGERALNSAKGIVSGIVGGAAAPIIGGAAKLGYDKFLRPIVESGRGLLNPEKEAARRLSVALNADQDLIAAGKAEGMTLPEWSAAKARGEPVTLADLGSSNTQALLRSAANTSPEGRALLEKVINERFAGQSERVADEVRNLVAGGANAHKTGDQLVAEYDKARVPAYRKAYREGDKEIISPVIERLMGSPTFENAMKGAVTSGKDRAIMEGYGAFNPGVTVENGMLKFTKTKPNGVPTYPNLQYWDAVKKELDGVAKMAQRSGDPRGDVAANMSKTLRDELDKAVPSYGDARGIAAQYFGESNALEAGQKLAGKKVDPKVIRDVMTKMKPDERDLFREGYASDWAGRVIGNISDSRDITKAMFNSPNERARAMAVFGPAGVAKMEARMKLETIMDGARKAMGNSTTARQLIEAGLAGGALEGYLSGWDPTHMAAGAASAAGARKMIGSEMAAGARKLIGKVDSKTAKLVAELLTSDDPSKLQKGLVMAQKNQRISDGLTAIANRMALAGQSHVVPKIPYSGPHLGPLQGPMPAAAEPEQNQSPRIGNQ